MHPILEEITGYLARIRADLSTVIDRTPPAAFDRRPVNGGWSGTGIIHHLGKVEGSSTKLLEGLFARAMADGVGAEPGTQSWLHSIDHLRVTDRTFRIIAPDRVAPDPAAEFAASWASLQAVRPRLLRAVASVDGRDLTTLSAPHPVLGPLNGYEWVLFIGQHEERHLSQLRETLSAG
jgi:hypothetical protein